MVRTAGNTIRVSAGKSSKKTGGGGSGGGNRSSSSAGSGKSGSSHLPAIPHCEVPSWQKPITSFFNSEPGCSKTPDITYFDEEPRCSSKEEGASNGESTTLEAIDKTENVNGKAESIIINDKNNTCDDEVPNKKRREEEEEEGKENIDGNNCS